ncbi:hypothetical protein AAFF_G00380050 [Aldrovandia affinis]|uniref:Choline transporter-like protein 2 n=1 Tax=Aldrovandia affinis TaxID=143900 RepID=A0AAD7T8X9_9TELE|nr:hypothetical protein AAFF_G00380050 [Aldrovandia affinis]
MEPEEKSPDSKYGEPRKFDPTFKGPIHNRGCTDIICCIIFVLAIVGYFAVGILAWSHGDPRKVIYPTDSRGQFCGQAGPLEKKPFLFYFNIMKCASPLVLLEFQCPTTQICVEKCPSEFLTLVKAKTKREHMDVFQQYCKEGTDLSTMSVPEILKERLCPTMLIPSKPFTHRCLPALLSSKGKVEVEGNTTTFEDEDGKMINATDLQEGAKKANRFMEARQVAMKIFEDYTQSWHWILLGLVIAMVVSLIFIVLLRFLAGVMVWVMIVLVILVLGYGTRSPPFPSPLKLELTANPASSTIPHSDSVALFQPEFSMTEIRQTWLAFLIILCIIEVIIILLLIFLRKRILIAIALIKEASRTRTTLWPCDATVTLNEDLCCLPICSFTFTLLTVVIGYWAITAVFLSTSNDQIYKVVNKTDCPYSMDTCYPDTFNSTNITTHCPDAECLFAFYGGESSYHKYLIFLQFYNVFLFFWCANFVTALGQVTLAGAFASYYWALKKPDDIPANPIFSSLARALRYHTGSLAFGSLILSIVQVIRVMLEYLDQKLKGAQNKCARFLLSCLKCCFWCLEKFIKFLNRNAYIMVAIYGKNFCTSARDAFFLLMRNILRVAVLDKVTDFLLFLGKLLIVGIVGIFSFFFFSGRIRAIEDQAPNLNYYWVPILTVAVGSYLIAHGFFSVYAMCVDTLFLCFCEDLERNDGSSERPYFMNPELHAILCGVEPKGAESADGPGPQETQSQPLQEQQEEEIQLKRQQLQTQENEEEKAPENAVLEATAETPLELSPKTQADTPQETSVGTPQETLAEIPKETPEELRTDRFVEDLERNDGSAERPYYMSQDLLSVLKKKNVEKSIE